MIDLDYCPHRVFVKDRVVIHYILINIRQESMYHRSVTLDVTNTRENLRESLKPIGTINICLEPLTEYLGLYRGKLRWKNHLIKTVINT